LPHERLITVYLWRVNLLIATGAAAGARTANKPFLFRGRAYFRPCFPPQVYSERVRLWPGAVFVPLLPGERFFESELMIFL
jgi:hypothetical protein